MSMADLGWMWVTLVCSLFVCVTTSQHQVMLAEQVYITSTVCGTTLDVGQPFDQWKRLRFLDSDSSCLGRNYSCRVLFSLGDSADPLSTDICVDFSRLRLHGRLTNLLMKDDSPSYSGMNRLTNERYPLIEKYMNTVVCIDKDLNLRLTFNAECDRPLDLLYVGWVYAYVQSITTGSIYFVDGGSRHRHRMSARGLPKVTLRSHLWADTPNSTPQRSTMSVSIMGVTSVGGDNHICLVWNPQVSPTLPRGVSIRVFKSYFQHDQAKVVYHRFKEGDRVEASPACYRLREIYEIVVEVTREPRVTLGAWNERQLLFDLQLGANNQLEIEGPSVDIEEDEDEEDDFSSPPEESNVMMIAVVSVGAVVVAFILMCIVCCMRRSSRHSTHGNEDVTASNAPPTNTNLVNTDRETDTALPMVPRVMPSAPSWDEPEGNPTVGPTRLRNPTGATSGQSPLMQNPPSYQDLFPETKP